METLDTRPDTQVAEAEYRRLLGWPRGHAPGDRALELAAWARDWYSRHGRPWVYRREVPVEASATGLRIEGTDFFTDRLRGLLHDHGADRAELVAVSAGPECEEHARALWESGRPDEYFFLEIFGSAVVEHLVAGAYGSICAAVAAHARHALAPYSPGYAGWDVSDQNRFFALMTAGCRQPFPGPLDVLASGMLRPKKSQLLLVGLTPRPVAAAPAVPCTACSLDACRYRRAPYRHARVAEPTGLAGGGPVPGYTVNVRALRKWARERVTLAPLPGGRLAASFRFDGTTCSNLGHPFAFDYRVELGPAGAGRPLLAADCGPVAGDTGHRNMCAYLADAEGLMRAIAAERPPLGEPLDAVLGWRQPEAPAGCHCTAASRAHKWRLALEAIHFALGQRPEGTTGSPAGDPTQERLSPAIPANSP